MININFGISNPWYKEDFKTIFYRTGSITKNKQWEIQITRYSFNIFDFSFDWTHRTDHAGVKLEFSLVGLSLHLQMYDRRHWDYENKTWEAYDE